MCRPNKSRRKFGLGVDVGVEELVSQQTSCVDEVGLFEMRVPEVGTFEMRAALLEALPPDPEAEARAAAFLERMGIKRREEGSES